MRAGVLFSSCVYAIAATLPAAGAGQVCSATSRLLIQRPIYDAVVERVLEKMAAVVVGKPLDAATTMGPLVEPCVEINQ